MQWYMYGVVVCLVGWYHRGASEQLVHLVHDWAMEAHTCMEYVVRVHSMPSKTAGHVPEVHVQVRVPLTDVHVHTCTLYNIYTHKSGYNSVMRASMLTLICSLPPTLYPPPRPTHSFHSQYLPVHTRFLFLFWSKPVLGTEHIGYRHTHLYQSGPHKRMFMYTISHSIHSRLHGIATCAFSCQAGRREIATLCVALRPVPIATHSTSLHTNSMHAMTI